MAQEVVEKKGVSRRSFLKGAGVVAGAAVVGLPLLQKALAQPVTSFAVDLPKETLLEMYRRMQRIRMIEDPTGEEAAHVGAIMALNKGDFLTTTHICVHELLGKGLEPKYFLAERAGKTTGICGGRWVSYTAMWDTERDLMVAGSGIVAAGVPHGLGFAKAAKLRGTGQVAMTVNGDGAMNEGNFNASLNMAAVWELPVVFHVVNNHWENYVTIDRTQSLTKAGQDLAVRAVGFGIPGFTVDGMDIFAVYKAAKYCIDRAREGKGPSLFESVCYDYGRGAGVGKWPLNRPGELEYWQARDPVNRFESVTVAQGLLSEAELEGVRKEVEAEIKEAEEFAKNSPLPDPATDEYLKYIREVFRA